ncbi:MAG TPA: hypothetical protein VGG39_26185 [Polyangiaceae bacterium]|jgi:hypothetical protein
MLAQHLERGTMSEFDPNAVDWGRTFAEALEIALDLKIRNAEDVVSEGVTMVIDGTAPFDPSGDVTLAAHVVAVADGKRRNQARVDRRRKGRGQNAKLVQFLDEAPPTPEELLEERAMGDRAFEALLAACEGDLEVRELVLLSRKDVDEAADQAETLGWKIERVRNARKRMTRLIAQVAESMQAWKDEDDP